MKKKQYREKLKPLRFPLLVLSGIINATGVTLFLVPSGVIDSGISGLSVLLSGITPLALSLYLLIFNIPLFLFGLKKQGWRFIVYSLTAILSYSLMAYIYQTPLGLKDGVFPLLNEDMLLAAIFGGLVSGIGSGLTIRFGGAIDGVEVLAVIFAKKINLTVGQFVMAFNAILYIAACFIFKNLTVGLYSIISYFIGIYAVDFCVEGLDKSKACIIITKNGKFVASEISRALGRGITVVDSKGYYLNQDSSMLYVVVNRFEISKLKAVITEADPTAFVTINDISEVLGSSIKMTLSKRKIKPKVTARPPIEKPKSETLSADLKQLENNQSAEKSADLEKSSDAPVSAEEPKE